MKTLLLISLILTTTYSFAQESFRKTYGIPNVIELEGNDVVELKLEKQVKFNDLSQREKDSIKSVYKLGSSLKYTVERVISDNKVIVEEQITIDESFYQKQSLKKVTKVTDPNDINGFVKFEESKIIVNPNLRVDENNEFSGRDTYYFELKNRQSIKLKFTEWNISTLTIPLKYHFRDKDEEISEEFSSSFSVNFFGGYSIGKTRFFFRDKVGNISNTWKFTGGLLIGASTVKLNNSNTSSADNPIAAGTEITKGLASVGLGLTYTFNKINFGVFYGRDYSVGDDAKKWNYNKKPWLGLAVGYSLFNF
jgi:hypothetical protein